MNQKVGGEACHFLQFACYHDYLIDHCYQSTNQNKYQPTHEDRLHWPELSNLDRENPMPPPNNRAPASPGNADADGDLARVWETAFPSQFSQSYLYLPKVFIVGISRTSKVCPSLAIYPPPPPASRPRARYCLQSGSKIGRHLHPATICTTMMPI